MSEKRDGILYNKLVLVWDPRDGVRLYFYGVIAFRSSFFRFRRLLSDVLVKLK